MSKIIATDHFETQNWEVTFEDLATNYADLFIGFTDDAPVAAEHVDKVVQAHKIAILQLAAEILQDTVQVVAAAVPTNWVEMLGVISHLQVSEGLAKVVRE